MRDAINTTGSDRSKENFQLDLFLLTNSEIQLFIAPLASPLMSLDSHIEQVLWTPDQISHRVAELAAQITRDFQHVSPPPVVVAVATGAFLFLADLVRQIPLPLSVDFIRAESYGSGTHSNEAPSISMNLKVNVQDKHVILVLSLYLSYFK